MKKLFVVSAMVAASMCVVSTSFAADVMTDTSYNWTGGYLGLHAGYGDANTDGIFDSSELPAFPEESTYGDDLDANGFVGGLQAGYNWQMDQFVWGIEGDVSFADLSDDVGDFGGNDRIAFDLNALASLRLRAGFAADRALFYVTGGLAYASGDFEIINNAGLGQDTGSVNLDSFGGVVGAGAAFATSENTSIRLEGLYYFFDDKHDTSTATLDSDPGDSLSFDNAFVIRAGLDYRF